MAGKRRFGSGTTELRRSRHVRFYPESDRTAALRHRRFGPILLKKSAVARDDIR
jgi:hypothetical protein